MAGYKFNISIFICLGLLFSLKAYSQQPGISGTHDDDKSELVLFKPVANYYIGSSFMVTPQLGSVTSFNFSPSLSIPLSPRLSVEGGIIASYYYTAPWKSESEGLAYGPFAGLSVYGSASYLVSPQLTLYGSAIKQISGTLPFNTLPKNSYTIGSSYNFGSFSIGVSFQTTKWDDAYSPYQISGPRGLNSPVEQRWPYIW